MDRFCLGVKDAFYGFMDKGEYSERLDDEVRRRFETVVTAGCRPPANRTSVDYAKGLGLSPHPDNARARKMFGAIDPAASDRKFEFGRIFSNHPPSYRCLINSYMSQKK